eukprot:3497425-Pyramimonas_sp.AAC.1
MPPPPRPPDADVRGVRLQGSGAVRLAGRARRDFNRVADALNLFAKREPAGGAPNSDQWRVRARILDIVAQNRNKRVNTKGFIGFTPEGG